ncbi:type III secretion protein [Brucella cytisi]|uniref:type III secretion protein n=1 Tax=Brucella cytisi TaxID=407152 RepID=UPI0016B03553|nr:type III secretion protein [Brucella cytisi]
MSVLGIAFALVFTSVGSGWAAEPRWPAGPYKYMVLDQSVRDTLTEFGRNIGVSIQMSPEIRGRVTANVPQGNAKEFLEWVCNRYGLVWYFDGATLHISNETENRTEILTLDDKALDGISQRLDSLGLMDPRFPVRIDREQKAASISGPPAYIALVKETVGTFTTVETVSDGPANVRVFRGRQTQAQSVDVGSPTVEKVN